MSLAPSARSRASSPSICEAREQAPRSSAGTRAEPGVASRREIGHPLEARIVASVTAAAPQASYPRSKRSRSRCGQDMRSGSWRASQPLSRLLGGCAAGPTRNGSSPARTAWLTAPRRGAREACQVERRRWSSFHHLCRFERLNLARRERCGSTQGRAPVASSEASFPAPGPMPKPWPENPVAMTRPGRLSTGEITGTASGVTSISPPQAFSTFMSRKNGKPARDRAPRLLELGPVRRGIEHPDVLEGRGGVELPLSRHAPFLAETSGDAKLQLVPSRDQRGQEIEEEAEGIGRDMRDAPVAARHRVAAVEPLAEREGGAADRHLRAARHRRRGEDGTEHLELRQVDALIAAERGATRRRPRGSRSRKRCGPFR